MPDPEMTEYGPVIRVRPSVGAGSPAAAAADDEASAGLQRAVQTFIDPAKVDAGSIVRALAIESAEALMRDTARGLARVFGLRYDELAAVCKRLAIGYSELAAAQAAPPG